MKSADAPKSKPRSAVFCLPAKAPDVLPWYTLCIDLIGPYKTGKDQNEVQLHCLTMIDPATGWFEIVKYPIAESMRQPTGSK